MFGVEAWGSRGGSRSRRSMELLLCNSVSAHVVLPPACLCVLLSLQCGCVRGWCAWAQQ